MTLSVYDEDELELFLCGEEKINMEDWRNNTKYKGDYNNQNQVIVWFWKVIGDLDENRKRRFLQFCTGANRVPAEGFAYFND